MGKKNAEKSKEKEKAEESSSYYYSEFSEDADTETQREEEKDRAKFRGARADRGDSSDGESSPHNSPLKDARMNAKELKRHIKAARESAAKKQVQELSVPQGWQADQHAERQRAHGHTCGVPLGSDGAACAQAGLARQSRKRRCQRFARAIRQDQGCQHGAAGGRACTDARTAQSRHVYGGRGRVPRTRVHLVCLARLAL